MLPPPDDPRLKVDRAGDPISEPVAHMDARLAIFSLPGDRDSILRVFEQRLGMNRIDARTRLHHLPGLLPESYDAEIARTACTQLEQLGATVTVVRAAEVPDLKHSTTLHHARCKPEGLVILNLAGAIDEVVPWNRLTLLSIADVAHATLDRSHAPDGVFRHDPGIAGTDADQTHYSVELWLTCEAPFRAFHVNHEQMNYEYLGARMSTSAIVNFGEFVRDLCRSAPRLSLTPTARAFRDGQSVEHYRLPSPEEHQRAVVLGVLATRQAPGARSGQSVAVEGHGPPVS